MSFFKKEAGLSTGAERAADRRWAKAVWSDEFYRKVTQDGRPLFTVSRQVRRSQERVAVAAAERAGRSAGDMEALKEARAGAGGDRLSARFGKHRRRSADQAVSVKGGRGRLTTARRLGVA